MSRIALSIGNQGPGYRREVYRFPNNYGASVLRAPERFNPSGKWEVVVLRFRSADNMDYVLDFKSPIPYEEMKNLTYSDVEKVLERIAAL